MKVKEGGVEEISLQVIAKNS